MNRSDLTKINTAVSSTESSKKAIVSTDVVTVKGPKEVVVTRDHSKLANLDFEGSGHTGFAGIKFGTTEEWNSDPSYIAGKGVLIVYTDYETKVDEHGQIIYYPNFKIGDGNAYLIDKPFVGENEKEQLEAHIGDDIIHITQDEREFWNNKLNYEDPEDSDLLVFTRN